MKGWVHTRTVKNYARGAWDREFIKGIQKLHRQRLNLNAWGGFQHVHQKEIFETKNLKVKFDFNLSENSYFYFFYNQKDIKKTYGIRLSLNPMYPSQSFLTSNFGEFKNRKQHSLPLEKGINSLEVHYKNQKALLKLNGKEFIFPHSGNSVEIGFMGSEEKSPVWIDSIHINKTQWNFNLFSIPPPLLSYISFIIIILIGFFFFLIIKKEGDFFLLMSVVSALSTLLAISAYFNYPALYQIPQKQLVTEEHIEENFQRLSTNQKPKTIFIGGSRTYGLGAVPLSLNWYNQLDLPESLNLGVIAANSSQILEKLKSINNIPERVILHMGVNDLDPVILKKNLEKIMTWAKDKKVQLIYLSEFNYINTREEIPFNYVQKNFYAIEELCKDSVLSCHNLGEKFYSGDYYDRGLIWTEWVHMSTYGQKVFAKMIKDLI